jgi:hypothetical protein
MRQVALLLGAVTLSFGCTQDSPGPGEESPPARAEPAAADGSPWRLVWADEFDTDGLPVPERWAYDVGGHGWGNDELQYYTEGRLENARAEGGNLILEARRDNQQLVVDYVRVYEAR